jgi:NAD+ synthase (glutamine-hydrolysing)
MIEESRDLTPVLLVGAPLRFEGKLFNCALGHLSRASTRHCAQVVLPNYREFYERRQFTRRAVALAAKCCF